jgi:hypothetical protein
MIYSGIRINTDVSGEHKMTNFIINDEQFSSIDLDVEQGFSISFDINPNFSKSTSIGFGSEWMLGRELEDANGGDFTFSNLYIAIYQMISKNEPLYMIGRLGYGTFKGDSSYTGSGIIILEGGIFYAYGFGYRLNEKLSLEGAYSHNFGTFSQNYYDYPNSLDVDYNLEYSRLNISLHYIY